LRLASKNPGVEGTSFLSNSAAATAETHEAVGAAAGIWDTESLLNRRSVAGTTDTVTATANNAASLAGLLEVHTS